jgi:membrane associated rhomboid family serine protease
MDFRSPFQRTSPIVLNLIIINSLVFLAQMAFGGMNDVNWINDWFALHHYKADVFKPHQLITHIFMHGGFMHLLLNMLGLWMFGSLMERLWGPKRFLLFYLICGVVAGLAQMGSYVWQFWNLDHASMSFEEVEVYQQILAQSATVGASGAIMGVLAAYGYTFPNTQLFIFPIPFPIKTKWAVTGIVLIDFFSGIANSAQDNVAHFAHIGGAICGLIIVLIWNKNNRQRFF